ncbi:transposase, partial [Bifidobacterium bifidum]
MAALRPGNGNAGQAGRPAVRRDRDAGDTEAPRRRVEEPEPGDAVMRE